MRTIVLTECPDEHLVWHDTSIWIKPLPEYLLDYGFWEDHLCDDEVLYKSACGLLMSYTWLIYYKSDHRIAVEMGLLPHDMNYDTWTAFTINLNLAFQVSPRYEYGELRLSRLNSLYRFGAAGFSLWNVVFGFVSRSTHYTAFFQRNFGWILAVFGYFTVLLSAMQVALATEKLGGSAAFQEFSLCIAMLSLAFVLFTVAIILFVWAFMFWFHLLSTAQYVKKTRMQRAATIGLASI
jgi:hypothetical protein